MYENKYLSTSNLFATNLIHSVLRHSLLLNGGGLMSLAPSLVHSNKKGGTVHMFIGDSNSRYYACLGTACVYCDDMDTAMAHLDFWRRDRDLDHE